MDAIELLREDHQKVLEMLDRLAQTPSIREGADEKVLGARKKLIVEIVVAESRHEAVEERYFWPMVRHEVPRGELLADQAVDQENAAKQLLDAMDKASPRQSDLDEMVSRLLKEGRSHIDYEQDTVWPEVQAAVGAARLAQLGDKMAAAEPKAPTRPHPETPSAAGVQQTLGRVAGLVDRIRDSLTRRGR